jgi:pyrroline-5-carboxylate reductase
MSNKIAIIGGGNLGTAIAEGLINSGFSEADHILITKRNIKTLHALQQKGVLVSDDNLEAVRFANLVILAVKPFQVEEVLGKLKDTLDPAKHVLISVITGVTIEQLRKAAGKKIPVIRAMPNTAIAIQESMTCLAAHEVSKEQIEYTEELFNQLLMPCVIYAPIYRAALKLVLTLLPLR